MANEGVSALNKRAPPTGERVSRRKRPSPCGQRGTFPFVQAACLLVIESALASFRPSVLREPVEPSLPATSPSDVLRAEGERSQRGRHDRPGLCVAEAQQAIREPVATSASSRASDAPLAIRAANSTGVDFAWCRCRLQPLHTTARPAVAWVGWQVRAGARTERVPGPRKHTRPDRRPRRPRKRSCTVHAVVRTSACRSAPPQARLPDVHAPGSRRTSATAATSAPEKRRTFAPPALACPLGRPYPRGRWSARGSIPCCLCVRSALEVVPRARGASRGPPGDFAIGLGLTIALATACTTTHVVRPLGQGTTALSANLSAAPSSSWGPRHTPSRSLQSAGRMGCETTSRCSVMRTSPRRCTGTFTSSPASPTTRSSARAARCPP